MIKAKPQTPKGEVGRNKALKALFIIFLWIPVMGFAQRQDRKSITNAISSFDEALVARDSAKLKTLLHDDLRYGHSNGWIETKSDVIGDLFNGKLTYKKIKAEAPEIVMEGNTASARTTVDIDVVMDGKPLIFKLKVLQVWVWKHKHWELFARQSVKM